MSPESRVPLQHKNVLEGHLPSTLITNIGELVTQPQRREQPAELYALQRAYGSNSAQFDETNFSLMLQASELGDSGKNLTDPVAPGDSLTYHLVFDVPQDVTLTRPELHAAVVSPGVRVKLG